MSPACRDALLKVVVGLSLTAAAAMFGEWREERKAKRAAQAEVFETLDSYRSYIESVMEGDECLPCDEGAR